MLSAALLFSGCSDQAVDGKQEEPLHPDQLVPGDAEFSDEVKQVFRNYNLVPVVVNGKNITDEILKRAMADYIFAKTPEEKFANKDSIKVWANKKGNEVYFWSTVLGTTIFDKADFSKGPLVWENVGYREIPFETERILIVEWKDE